MSDPWEPFDRLRAAIENSLPSGVNLKHWVLSPGDDGEGRSCQLILEINPSAFAEPTPEETPEAKATREQFEQMMLQERVLDEKQKNQKAVQGLLRIRKDGIFDEDDTPEA